MKLIQFSLVFLTAAAALLAHEGHGLGESGLGHYLTSAIHVAPAILGAVFLIAFAFKKARSNN